MNQITVSIFMLTYNQELFIAQAIESALMQKTSFDYQLVIGEDCSTDKTRSICEKYANQFPDKIKLLPTLDNNIGLIANYMRTIKECDGKYIAICDGDDYWIDEFKLQKQVDFLENNPDYSIVYTPIKLLYNSKKKENWNPIIKKNETDFDDLIFENYIPSVSAMFKNMQNENNKIPEWLLKYPFGDWPTYLWTIKKKGKIGYINDVTAVYRIDAGISTERRKVNSNILKTNICILKDVLKDVHFASKKQIASKSLSILEKKLVSTFNKERRYGKGLLQFMNNCRFYGFNYPDLKMYFYSILKSLK